jgi:hypothetical protein
MTLKKTSGIDRIEVIEGGAVVVTKKTFVFEDGVEIASASKQDTIFPGDDYTGEDANVQALCASAHTAEVISSYKAAIAAQGV